MSRTDPGRRTWRARLYERRVFVFVGLSFLLHLALVYSLPKLSASPSVPSDLKEPLYVDLMDVDGPAPAPANAPPPVSPSVAAAPSEPVQPQPKQVEPKSPETSLEASRAVEPREKPKPRKEPEPRVTAEKDPVANREKAAAEPERPLPSLDELMPTMRSLLDIQQPATEPLHVSKWQEGMERLLGDTRYEAYLLELKQKVKREWTVNPSAGIREGTTVVWVIVAKDGSLWSLDLLKTSGMMLHDYEAMRAVKNAFPLRPPPEALLNEKGLLPIRFSFHYLLSPAS